MSWLRTYWQLDFFITDSIILGTVLMDDKSNRLLINKNNISVLKD